ncbi:MAG: putative permease often clustered with de novo purine synthesis [Ignavibacteriae bacterium]|nr:MAG: putative permease often clustered with de novo purine synthesis [Ignavibacteriota bacterium]
MQKEKEEIVILIVGLILIALLLYTVQNIISPFIILLIALYVFYQYRTFQIAKRLMWLSIIIFLIWTLFELRNILLPFIISLLFAYLFNPVILYFENKKIQRWLSSLFVIISLIIIIAVLLILVLPPAFNQLNNLMYVITDLTKELVSQIRDGSIFVWLEKYGVPTNLSRDVIMQQLTPKLELVLKDFLSAIINFFSSASAVITQIINLLIVPFLTFYLLKDFTKLKSLVKSWIPESYRKISIDYYKEVDNLIGRYLRGAILVAFIHGILASILLWIFGIKYSLVLGMIAGLLSLIPYIGLLISLSLSLFIALFSGDPVWLKIIFVLITYAILQILEASVISPNILGRQVGLHPVLLILCLLVFGYFIGFVGLLIAVPSTALILMSVKFYFQRKSV